MKKLLLTLFTFYFYLSPAFSQGSWSPRAPLPTYLDATFGGISGFSIGNYGYAGLGENNAGKYSDTLWQFNPANDSWIKKANFPGTARISPASFVIGNKAYVVTGSKTNFGSCVTECWEYDAANNTWLQKANFPGPARFGAVGFAIGGKGYVGTGGDSNLSKYYKDFYAYDTANNSWTRIADFGGIVRGWASGFTANGKGYVCFGQDSALKWHTDMWEYDTGTNSWTQKTDYPGTPTYIASGFVIGNNIYVGSCEDGSNRLTFDNRFWKYNVSNNLWSEVASTPLPTKLQATAFAIGDTGYLGFGFDSLGQIVNLFDRFYPDTVTGITDIKIGNTSEVTIYPNPFKNECFIILPNNPDKNAILFTLYDIEGKKINIDVTQSTDGYILHRNNLCSGVYILCIESNNQIIHKKLIITN